ncbi:GNAT family N-acetyltransferase [Actinoplanes sp. NPDC000266]
MTAIDQTGWSSLTGVPPELVSLAERCFEADGGLPLATEPAFLARRWSSPGAVAFALRSSSAVGASSAAAPLVAAGAVRPIAGGAAFTGLVDPAARGRGLGARLLDRGLAEARALAAAAGAVTVEIESLTDDADALFISRGLRRVFAEDVMRIDLSGPPPKPAWVDGATVVSWSSEVGRRFHAVYEAAFRERPGFPGDPADEWIAENEEDEDFRPGSSLLVSVPGVGDAGFVTAAQDWIVQVGVVPAARRRGLGAALVSEALGRLRAGGSDHAWLTVNLNNPGAAAVYRRLGFEHRGRRARYRTEAEGTRSA